jgi:hypothetical protein
MTMTVYEMRTYTVQVGKMPEAIRLYSQFGYPALHKGGFDKKLVGYFISDTGTLHQLVHLWKFDDDADRRAHWAALFADKDFIDGFAAQFRRMVKIFKTAFHSWQSISGNSNKRSFRMTAGAFPANSPAADPGSVRSVPYYSSRRSTHGARPPQQ